ncbi:condensin complex protein MksE [Pseudoalteromonas maricaloris]|uniref:condensin complex protein MksE n=1 Tax=Pseudoalteromonas maricaloris TaxID=184924 RepID=UPI00057C3B90|nr:hypothetical protein [Pseudoalteromonas flavipulchra]KID37626.1 hypothetical protein QT15_06180 [Pseudoalteromonas flavipulchra NCIMB 2033 = ATCC BAA-314]MBD0783818.1 hypothetical protein [Pseudoalteromonas flavipulchra]MBE0374394.1 hypothetical protein [Pseudoalteromonas flavipulchra NCIMB 2033 = ATCC BAA-314]
MESEVIYSFEEIPYTKSTEIYRLFSQGRVLNKQRYDDVHGCLVDDDLFTLVFNKIKHFSLFFKHMGYDLKFDEEGDFYFTQDLRDANNDESDDNAMKIQSILLFIGRYYATVGDLAQLQDPMFGLKESDINALKQDDLLASSLKALRIDNWDKALEYLTSRSLVFKVSQDKYVLSKAAMTFLSRLIEAHSKFINDK